MITLELLRQLNPQLWLQENFSLLLVIARNEMTKQSSQIPVVSSPGFNMTGQQTANRRVCRIILFNVISIEGSNLVCCIVERFLSRRLLRNDNKKLHDRPLNNLVTISKLIALIQYLNTTRKNVCML